MRGIIFILMLCTSTAHAQVNRCTDTKTGKITYSDTLCDTRQKSAFLEARKSEAELWEIQRQADEANERKYRQQAIEQANAPVFQQRNRRNSADSYECRLAQKNYETTSSSATRNKDVANSYLAKVNAACGTTTEPSAEPVLRVRPRPSPQPSTFTHCDTGFCYDNTGGVYTRNGDDFLIAPNGRTCFRTGAMWNCN